MFGISPSSAAMFVWSAFKILKLSEPLNNMAREWLTSPSARDIFKAQYVIICDKFVGRRLLSWRRFQSVALLFVMWWIVLGMSLVLGSELGISVLAQIYFASLYTKPVFSCLLIAFSMFIMMTLISLFSWITLSVYRPDRVLRWYVASLCLGYFIVILLSTSLSDIAGWAYSGNGLLKTDFNDLFVLFVGLVKDYFDPKMIATALMSPWLLLRDYTLDDDADTFEVLIRFAYVGHIGIESMFVTSVLGLTLTNLGYVCGLSMMRLEYLLREKYGISQEYIWKEPIEYVGRVATIFVFVLVFLAAIGANTVSSISVPWLG